MIWLTSFIFISCGPSAREGTIVGNPSQTRPSLSELSTRDYGSGYEKGFWFTGTEGVLTSIELIDIDGHSTTESHTQHMTLLGEEVFELPAGVWSEIHVSFEDIYLSGYIYESQPQLIMVERLDVELYAPEINIDGSSINFELGVSGWLDSYYDWSTSGDIIISETENSNALDALMHQSALYLDLNDDGRIGEAERESALLAAGADRELGDVSFVTDDMTNISAERGCQSVLHTTPVSRALLLLCFSFALIGYRRR